MMGLRRLWFLSLRSSHIRLGFQQTAPRAAERMHILGAEVFMVVAMALLAII